MQIIRTRRLDLIPATLALVEADLQSPEALARLLGAAVPASWPPGEYDRSAMEFFRDRLAENPGAVGWYGWYAVHRQVELHGSVLIGSGGYLGPPGSDGVAEIGYSVVPESRALGFATELVQALVSRAFSKPEVVRVIAHTTPANPGSVRVLERCGFSLVGPGSEPGTVQYATTGPTT
jgi:RimJ/RimL family protein N-acetyltransferase